MLWLVSPSAGWELIVCIARQVVAGQTAALALKKVKRGAVRKGMVLVDASLRPQARFRRSSWPSSTCFEQVHLREYRCVDSPKQL